MVWCSLLNLVFVFTCTHTHCIDSLYLIGATQKLYTTVYLKNLSVKWRATMISIPLMFLIVRYIMYSHSFTVNHSSLFIANNRHNRNGQVTSQRVTTNTHASNIVVISDALRYCLLLAYLTYSIKIKFHWFHSIKHVNVLLYRQIVSIISSLICDKYFSFNPWCTLKCLLCRLHFN
jgi:hypothetical protein